ncbi:MAG: HEPN domain-containing protein [Firmicutes bacterium]|nr:HEPN domain-containing protein [Bacillota bacterium]
MEEHSELVRYRLEMARATLRDALLLKEQGGSPWGIVNRAYYAMFYATLALLTLVGKGTSKHGGVIALFDQYFVKTGNLPQEMSKWLHKAFDMRQIGDYRELVVITEDQVEEILGWAKEFVREIEVYLDNKLQN